MPTTYGTIQTMSRAYQHICEGIDPWIALGNFRNAWYGYAKDIRPELVSAPPVPPEHDTEYTLHWRAFCAASVEFLCDRYQVPCPAWVHDPQYTLKTPWWNTSRPDSASVREELMQTAPKPFARRNIFCSNRLYQNKYESGAWAQEARAMGLKGADVWRYVRENEIRVHGG